MTSEERAARREAEREAIRAEQFTKRVNEFKATFLERQARRIYNKTAVFSDGDRVGYVLYDMVFNVEELRKDLRRRIESCQQLLTDATVRMEAGLSPGWYSDGILASSGREVDELTMKHKVTCEHLAKVARATGWRVRELEDDVTRAKQDELANVCVVKSLAEPGFVVYLKSDDTARLAYLGPDGFTADGHRVTYATEELAWSALHVYVNGRTL
jgi:hypothetical protein